MSAIIIQTSAQSVVNFFQIQNVLQNINFTDKIIFPDETFKKINFEYTFSDENNMLGNNGFPVIFSANMK
jgi:hypothetical protein